MGERSPDAEGHPLVLPSPELAPQVTGAAQGRRLVMEMGRALHRFGTPAHRLEDVLTRVARQLGLEASFFAVPTALFGHFGPLGRQQSAFVRIDDEDVHLGKIAALDEVVKRLLTNAVTPAAALVEIREVAGAPSRYGRGVTLSAFAVASAAGAVFFGGGWAEVGVGALLGTMVGFLAMVLATPASRPIFVPLAATLCASGAAGLEWFLGGFATEVATLAGVIYLLPGLTLTVALTEVSTRNLVAGTARLMVAMLTLLGLGFGVILGRWLSALSPSSLGVEAAGVPVWVSVAAVLVAPLAFAVLFHARGRDMVWILVAGVSTFLAARTGSIWGGSTIGAWLGAVIAGVVGNVWGRFLDRPPIIVTVPAIMLLVPGSLGFRSVVWMMADDTMSGVDAAFETGLVAMALAVGLLMANVIVPPRRRV